MPNGLEKYVSFIVNNKLNLINSFQFLISSSDSVVKNFGKDDFNIWVKKLMITFEW